MFQLGESTNGLRIHSCSKAPNNESKNWYFIGKKIFIKEVQILAKLIFCTKQMYSKVEIPNCIHRKIGNFFRYVDCPLICRRTSR